MKHRLVGYNDHGVVFEKPVQGRSHLIFDDDDPDGVFHYKLDLPLAEKIAAENEYELTDKDLDYFVEPIP